MHIHTSPIWKNIHLFQIPYFECIYYFLRSLEISILHKRREEMDLGAITWDMN